MAAFAKIALNETQSIAVRCQIGTFSACPKGSKVPFFGCCTSETDPCKQGCKGSNLQPTLHDPEESYFTDQACDGEAGGLFYTCAAGQFVGCCTSNPCQSPFYCPSPNLRAATRITFDTSDTGVTSSSATNTNTATGSAGKVLAPGALAGIAVGACALLLALGLGIFLFLRRRKRAKQSSVSTDSSNSAAMRFEPLRTGVYANLIVAPSNKLIDSPSGPGTPRRSTSCLPVGTLYDAHSLPRPLSYIHPAGHTENDSRSAVSLGHPQDPNFKHEDLLAAPPNYESSHLHAFLGMNTSAITIGPDYVQPTAVIPELDSRPASTAISELESRPVSMAIPELPSTSINEPANSQSTSPFSRIPFPINIPPSGKQERRDEEADDFPRMRGSVAGPGWDDWNEQPSRRSISRPPSAVFTPSQVSSNPIPLHPQTSLPGPDHTSGLLQQVPRPIKGQDEEKGP